MERISGSCRAIAPIENSVRSVSSSVAPSGRSTTTASSDLLSKGSSLTVTLRVTNRMQTSTVATPTAERNIQAERRERTTGVAKRR